MVELKYIPIFGFSGTNRNVSPFLTKEGEVADSENLTTEKIGVFKKTGDYLIKNAQITASKNILGGVDFLRADGTHEHIVAIDGDTHSYIYKDVSGTWTLQVQYPHNGKKVRFAYSPSLDSLFAVNESDDTLSYNGSSWSKYRNLNGGPRGKVVLSFGSRIYILNATVVTANSSLSPSISPSASPSLSPSKSPSVSPSVSTSISPSVSKSPSISPSVSPSVSVSPSISPSVSPSVSTSPSISTSPSASPSVSVSPSVSTSPSSSVSPSASTSPSPSVSPSVSISPSVSPSTAPSTTTYPTRAYRSSLVDSGSITWDTTNDWIVFDDVIVGGGINGDNMLVMCKNSVYGFTLNDDKYPVSTVGCVSHESIVSYKSLTFWAADDGLYMWNGSRDYKVSLPIQEVWDTLSIDDKENIQCAVLGDNLYIFLGTITIDGREITNAAYCYDISQDDWNRIRLATKSKSLHTFVNSSGRRLFMGDNDGKIYQMFTGGSQNGSEFKGMLETDWIYGSGEKVIDTFMEVWGFGKSLSANKIHYKVDDGEYREIGELNGFTDKITFKATGYRIKFLMQEISKNNLYEFDRLEVGYLPRYTKKSDTQS